MKKGKVLGILAVLCCLAQCGYAKETYIVPDTNPTFKYVIFDIGDTIYIGEPKPDEGIPVNAKPQPEYIDALKAAGEMWARVIQNTPTKPAVFAFGVNTKFGNSGAYSSQAKLLNDNHTTNWVEAIVNNKAVDPSAVEPEYHGSIATDLFQDGCDISTTPTALNLSNYPSFYITMAHEMGHALGIMATTNDVKISEAETYQAFSNPMSLWTQNVRVWNTEKQKEIIPTGGMAINLEGAKHASDFDLVKYSPYASGSATIKVLGGNEDYDTAKNNIKNNIVYNLNTTPTELGKGLINYSSAYSKLVEGTYKPYKPYEAPKLVYGLPIHPGDGTTFAELSHIELRNSYMSHQHFRAWGTFMEAELASLIDIGYKINLRDYFGKSYYLNNLTTDNTTGYGKWDGTKYLNQPSEIINGVGLHIYGDRNTITQKSDILSTGAGSFGTRIEGIKNTFILDGANKIKADGDNSIGLGVTWGSGHNVTLKQGSEISANGKNGIGLAFDFGKNYLGLTEGESGSYINFTSIEYQEEGQTKDKMVNYTVPDELNAALADTVNINGTVSGNKAAIYVAPSAYVKTININNGADIKGNIISEWNSKYAYDPGIKVQTGGEIKYTDLVFDKYNKNFEHNILGSEINNTLDVKVKDGTLGLKNTELDVHSLNNQGIIDVNGQALLTTSDGSIAGSGTINLNKDGILGLETRVQNISNTVNFNGGALGLGNYEISQVNLENLNLNNNSSLTVDIDYENNTMDTITVVGETTVNPEAKLNVITTLLNKEPGKTVGKSVTFISPELNNTALLGHITSPETYIYDPIYKYNSNYFEKNGIGAFGISHRGGYDGINPSVMAGAVGAQIGSFLTQINTYEQAFANMDQTMLMTKEQRQAMKFANKYASTQSNDGVITFSPNQVPEENKGVWFRPFVTFEKVNLNGGPNVENTSYGTLLGGESGIIELSRGWDMTWGAYVGYNGSHQNYDGVSIYQNGGTLGLNAAWYKGNFFTGLTANVGANVASADNMYGNENFTMLATGIASKTGYNWELFNSKFIIQPSFLISYTFVNTFDYTNAAGLSIHSSPLNVIQLAPGIKFIGNLKNGWQPYANVQMIWNLMDDTKFSANNVSLPNTSVDPYVQYGVGVQKRWGERFTGYFQTMIRNGGRNGVVLSAGFRWALGKTPKKLQGNNTNKNPKISNAKVKLDSWR